MERLNLKLNSTVPVSSSTDVNVPIGRFGPVLVFWKGVVHETEAYCMPKLNSALLGLTALRKMKPDFDWKNMSLKRGIDAYPNKKFIIDASDIPKVIGSKEKIEYFLAEHNVRIHISNEYGSQMILTIVGCRFDVDVDAVGETISHLAPSLKSITDQGVPDQ